MEYYATAAQVYACGLVFARLGAMVMLIPGFGDDAVPPRIRLAFAFLMALLITPIVASNVGGPPGTVGEMGGAIIKEVLVGLMIGTILRVLTAALNVAGEIIAIQTTLSFAQTVDPAQGMNGNAISSFLGLLGLMIIMTTDLHHLFLGAIVRSYSLFPFTQPVDVNDGVTLMIRTVADAFALGVQLAAPIIVFSLVLNVSVGLISRVMPQFQIFFVTSPLSVLMGLSILALGLGIIGVVWADRYRALLQIFN